MLKTLVKYIGKYKWPAIITPLFVVGEVFFEILIPYITANIIDEGISVGNMDAVYYFGGQMLLFALISLIVGALAGIIAPYASTGFANNLRRGIFANVQRFSFANIDKFSTASLITRMTTDVSNIANSFGMILRIAVRAPLMLVCSMFMCYKINAALSRIFLIALVVLAIAMAVIIKFAYPMFRRVFDKYDDLNNATKENISAIRVVKSFVREDFENEKFVKASGNLYKMFCKAEILVQCNMPIMNLVVYFCMLSLSWFGAHFIVLDGTMTTGDLTSIFVYVMQMLMSLMMLSMIFVMITMSGASAKRIAEVLQEKPEIENCADPVYEMKDGSIDFDDVNFRYAKEGTGEYTLQDIDLHIKSGQTIGVIGGTGSGKSSLVSLISRLYDATTGSVKVGGVDVKKYDIETLRNNVSVVLQKNILFSGTVLDNLRWGNMDATREECIEACKLACADEFVQKMENGYDTWIEQGGANVSGGQRQRLCIARALLKNPKVLILDDSTSAVDTATDAQIKRAMKEVIPGVTKIIVSQRISSIEGADKIITMQDGRITAFDTHENLLKISDAYRDIYEIQQHGDDFDASEGGDE